MGNFQEKVGFIWAVADLLRGDYKQSDYGKVILPFTVLRRLDCVLEPTKQKVLEKLRLVPRNADETMRDVMLGQAAGQKFYNTSKFTFTSLLTDPEHLAADLNNFINGFSPGSRDIFIDKFKLSEQIARLDEANILFLVVSKFTEIDLHPEIVDNVEMGYVFEELIRRFSEASNETAGEHFTPREVIRLMVNLLFLEDADALTKKGVIRTLYDCACGTGGMLSVAESYFRELNPSATLSYLTQSTTPGALTRQLTERGIEPPPYSDHWQQWHVSDILRHPCYVGRPVWNRRSVGDYAMFMDGTRVERRPGSGKVIHERKDWVLPDERLFDPVVDEKTWQAVQEKLEKRPKQPRRARRSYIYAGLVFCGHCGSRLIGTVSARQQGKAQPIGYVCGTYQNWRGPRDKCPCQSYRVTQDVLDAQVRAYLSDTGPHVKEMLAVSQLPRGQARQHQWRAVIQKTKDAFDRMLERILPVLPTDPDPREAEVAAAATRGEGICGTGVSIELLLTGLGQAGMLYTALFELEEPALRKRLGELEAEHSRMTQQWTELPTQRSKDKAKARMIQLEAEMAEIEGKLANAVDEVTASFEEFKRLSTAWEQATAAMETEVRDRRRAEAIRQVVSRITVYWRTTERPGKRPVREVQDFDIEPISVKTGVDCRSEGMLPPARRNPTGS